MNELASGRNVWTVIGVETVIIVACVVAVAAHVALLRRRARIDAATRPVVSGLLHRYLESGELDDELRHGMRRLSSRRQLPFFTSFSGMFSGRERDLLHRLSKATGLLSLAERRCRSVWWWRRLEGIRLKMVLGGGDELVPRMFDDRRAEVRAVAAEWAADHPSPVVIRRLVQSLGDDSAMCRFVVKDALRRLGASVVVELADHLRSSSVASEEVLEVASWLADSELLDAATDLSDDASPAVRRRVVELAGKVGGPEALVVVSNASSDEDAGVRSAAMRAIGRIGDWQTASMAATALHDPSWDVRREAGDALRSLGAPGVLLLRQSLKSPDPFAADMARHVLDLPSVLVESQS